MEAFAYISALDPRRALPTGRTGLNELERAIYSTVAYRDVFDFAPSLDEIHRFLHWIRCERTEVERAVSDGPLSSRLASDGRFYALRERAHLLQLRAPRQELAERFFPVALRYARYLANLPHVRMVGITGSLAARNVRADCDIDFMIVTDAGAMWRSRALAMVLALIDRKFGSGRLCPNFFLSVAAIGLERQSLYDAHELAQMIPLFGRDTYAELRRANRWTETCLPNAQGPPSDAYAFDRPPLPGVKTFVEWGSRSVLGRMLENFEAERKIRRFNHSDRFRDALTQSHREGLGLRDHVRQEIETAWQRRLDWLAAEEAARPA
jgi:hypothetical protein